jgi:hypothetical protein
MSGNTANSTAAYRPYDDVYGNTVQDRMYGGRVQSLPREDIDLVRRQQLDDFYRPADPRDRSDLSERNLHRHNSRPSREHSAPGRYQDQDRRRRRRDSDESSEDSSSSRDGRGSYSGDRRRRGYFHRERTQSEKRTSDQQERKYDGDLRSRVQNNFDTSGDGIFAAAIGAGCEYTDRQYHHMSERFADPLAHHF